MDKKKIRPLQLEIDPDIWRSFKFHIPRTMTLNQAVAALITTYVKKKKKTKIKNDL